jgi:hypothetical protein
MSLHSPVLGRVKGWLLAMLAPKEELCVAPVPLRALAPACAPWPPQLVGARDAPTHQPASGGPNKGLVVMDRRRVSGSAPTR